jgi:aminoglycoside/choline kinase family phosphotransferase
MAASLQQEQVQMCPFEKRQEALMCWRIPRQLRSVEALVPEQQLLASSSFRVPSFSSPSC